MTLWRKYTDEKPDDDTNILVSFNGTFDDKNFSLSYITDYVYVAVGITEEPTLSKDYLDDCNYDLIIRDGRVLVHPNASVNPSVDINSVENLYWCYQCDVK